MSAATVPLCWSADVVLREDTASFGVIPVQFKAVEG